MTNVDSDSAECPFCAVRCDFETAKVCEHFIHPEDEVSFERAYWTLFPYPESTTNCCETVIARDLLRALQDEGVKDVVAICWPDCDPLESLSGYDRIDVGDGGFYSPSRTYFRRLCETMNAVAKARDEKVEGILKDYRDFQAAWDELYEQMQEVAGDELAGNSVWDYLCSFAPNKSFERELRSAGSPEDRGAGAIIFRLFQSRGGHRDMGWDSLGEFEEYAALALNHPERIPEATNALRTLIEGAARAHMSKQADKVAAPAENSGDESENTPASDEDSTLLMMAPSPDPSPPDSNRSLGEIRKVPGELLAQLEKLEQENQRLEKSATELHAKNIQLELELHKVRSALLVQSSKVRSLRGAITEEKGRIFAHCPNTQYWLISLDTPAAGRLNWGKAIVTLGRDPVDDEFLDELLEMKALIAMEPGCVDAEVMIVGRESCDITQVRKQISARRGRPLRIYSQEMALLALATGRDPFEALPEGLQEMGRSHPVLSLLMEDKFEWPALCQTTSGGGGLVIGDWNPNSPLTAMGYHVGREFTDSRARRVVLQNIVEGELIFPDGTHPKIKKDWGKPQSKMRLRRIALHLVQNITLPGRKETHQLASEHWRADYKWLKDQYGKLAGGGWPSF
jgi:hypothetical protein